MLRIENVKIYEDFDDDKLLDYVIKKYHLKDINSINIVKKSIDARNKNDIHYIYSFDIDINDEAKYPNFKHVEINELTVKKNRNSKYKPIIIGSGPAGLFCALTFIENGYKPIIIEQGLDVDSRVKMVDKFRKTGILNEQCNVQFGEGGAGTFSDGKLTTGINSPLIKKVLDYFYKFGAPKEILYLNKPHIGTDNLVNILRNIRKYIETNGGKYYFNTKLININKDNDILKIECSNNLSLETDALVLAIGHSARDTYQMLYDIGINMKQKNFSVGVRIEHARKMIDENQYGRNPRLNLPAAEYKLVHHGSNKRSCYTFCMCPGGEVIASNSSKNQVVTNGMSTFKRDKENSNAALLVNVLTSDLLNNHPLAGIKFCEDLEEKAYELGGGNGYAPVQRVEDFLLNKPTTRIGSIKPTYKPGYKLANLNDILPQFVSSSLKEGIMAFDKKIKGFANFDAILTGVETRTSAPLTIIRTEDLEASISGIYPCGEGAGYAGGITSSAIDGIKVAIKIIEK